MTQNKGIAKRGRAAKPRALVGRRQSDAGCLEEVIDAIHRDSARLPALGWALGPAVSRARLGVDAAQGMDLRSGASSGMKARQTGVSVSTGGAHNGEYRPLVDEGTG